MRCPFLEEVVVRYCKASSIKKMIPTPSLVSDDPCIGCPEKCATYQESALIKPNQQNIQAKSLKEEVRVKETKQDLKECIWMKAGVIAYRLCTSNYDCKNCEFDQMLTDSSRSAGDSPMMKEAIEKLRKMPPEKRKCRYMLTGDISFKLCANNYECWHCQVDQMISDLIESHPLLVKKRAKREEKVETVRGFAFHPKAYYQPNHIWLKIDRDNSIKIGIDDFAVKILGDLEKVTPVVKGEELALEAHISTPSGSRIFQLPVMFSGKVIKTNEEVLANPKLVQRDPYEKGWLFMVENENLTDTLVQLLHGDAAKNWLEKDFDNLKQALQEACEITIADGGELVSDFRNQLSPELITKLVTKFLIERKEK
ncbi:MAG: glycine cleavage system protein H [candidate division WOR-3 bacterium]